MSRAWPVPNLDPGGSLAMNARRILAVRMAEVYSFSPAVPREDAVAPLHAMRISAKRLRYTLELFRSVWGEVGERQIERVRAIQEELGQLHDHDVRLALIDDELASLDHGGATATEPGDPRPGLLALRERQRASRRRHHRAFVELWNRLNAEGLRRDLVSLSAMPLPALTPTAAVGDAARHGDSEGLDA